MTTLSKTKHANPVKLQYLNNEQLIQAALNWTEQQYCDFKFNAGLSYAKRMTDNDELGFDFLVKTRFFWQWWKNEWAKRDAEFLETYSSSADGALLYDNYLFQHNIQRLKSDDLMEKKACSMVGYAVDEYMRTTRKELVK